jgi:hypothetical protein
VISIEVVGIIVLCKINGSIGNVGCAVYIASSEPFIVSKTIIAVEVNFIFSDAVSNVGIVLIVGACTLTYTPVGAL